MEYSPPDTYTPYKKRQGKQEDEAGTKEEAKEEEGKVGEGHEQQEARKDAEEEVMSYL